MAANTAPIFPKTPKVRWAATNITAANTAVDGTGTVTTIFTAGIDGSRVDYLKVRPRGTNVASVLRVFINNGLTNATAANNILFMERTLPADTISQVAELKDTYIPLDVSIDPSYTIFVTLGTAIAAGISVTAVGGDY